MAKPNEIEHAQTLFKIRVAGELTEEWSDWFEGLTIIQEVEGETLITGKIEDQAVLYSLLKKIRNLGLSLISINQSALIHKSNLHIQGEENEK